MTDEKRPEKVMKSDEEWRRILSPVQYEILRKHGTERAFTGPHLNDHEPGVFLCAGCGEALFDAATKYDSGSGWPSFYQPLDKSHLEEISDTSYGMSRVEVRCARCGGHLGHVFPDGPRPTGIRYCINGAALKKEPRAK